MNIKQAVRENGKVPGVTNLEGITDVGLNWKNKKSARKITINTTEKDFNYTKTFGNFFLYGMGGIVFFLFALGILGSMPSLKI
jgi:hypothetical protein